MNFYIEIFIIIMLVIFSYKLGHNQGYLKAMRIMKTAIRIAIKEVKENESV